MDWGFRVEIPAWGVREIGPDGAVVGGWGVHCWRGRWLVSCWRGRWLQLLFLRTGTSSVEPEVQAWVTGIPVRLRTLQLSLVAPDEFTRMLRDHR